MIAAVLLLPPWISRAVVIICARDANDDVDNGHDDDYGTSNREVLEITIMASLQDMTVAAFAISLVLLPGLTLIRRMVGPTAKEENHRSRRHRSRHQRHHNKTSAAALSFLLAAIIYALFVLPVWLDMASQILSGLRIRADYLSLTFANFGMFSSSMGMLSQSLLDSRILMACLAMLWSFKRFWIAIKALALSLPSNKASPKINQSAGFLRSTGRRIRLRCCVPPLPFLCSVASLYFAFVLSCTASMLVSQSSTANALKFSNELFLVAAEMLSLGFLTPSDGFLQPSSTPQPYFSFGRRAPPSFLYPTERYKDLDHTGTFPFYRRTLGFKGPKAFDIRTLPNGTKPNIVLIMMETWRHYDVGVLGGIARKRNRNRTATPNFDQLAKGGVLFDNFYANGIQTTRTLMSTLFGTMPQFSQAAAMDSPDSTSLNMASLPSILKMMGYNTTVFASATDLSYQNWNKFLPGHGFDAMLDVNWFENRWHELNLTSLGTAPSDINVYRRQLEIEEMFDMRYNDDFPANNDTYAWNDDVFSGYYNYPQATPNRDGNEPRRTSWGLADEESFRVLADEITRLSTTKAPFFFDFYSISSHHPFDVPSSFKVPSWIAKEAGENEEYRKYLEILAYSDKALGDFFQAMRKQGVMNNTVFVVAGDHGFGFCEHKPCFEGANIGNAQSKLYDVATRVPFLIVSDLVEKRSQGRVIREAASQVDLMPTVMDIVGISEDGFSQHSIGRSLMRRVGLGKAVAPLMNTFNDQAIGMKRGGIKYVFEGSRIMSIFNITGASDESAPLYQHRMQRREDPLTGAPRDLMEVKEQVAKILADTNRCYKNNAFMPEGAAREVGGGLVDGENETIPVE